jgi:NADH:ubiquinone oxidoreductase subunit E
MAQTEIYAVAAFYAHYAAPPSVTVRVCDSLQCAMA